MIINEATKLRAIYHMLEGQLLEQTSGYEHYYTYNGVTRRTEMHSSVQDACIKLDVSFKLHSLTSSKGDVDQFITRRERLKINVFCPIVVQL